MKESTTQEYSNAVKKEEVEYVENRVVKIELVDLTEDEKEEGPSGVKKLRLDGLVGADLLELKSLIRKEMIEIMKSQNFDKEN